MNNQSAHPDAANKAVTFQLLWRSAKVILLSIPVRIKILGLALGLIALLGGVTIYRTQQEVNRNTTFFTREESKNITLELSYQARDYLLINDLFGLTTMLKNGVNHRPDLGYAFVVDGKNQILAHTFGSGFPIRLLDVAKKTLISNTPVSERIMTNEGPIWDTGSLIFPAGDMVLHVGVKEENIQNQLSVLVKALKKSIVIVAVIGFLLSLLLTWLIMKPVKQLLEATSRVRRGDYALSLTKESNDEFGLLMERFNEMVAGLKKAEQDRLEKVHLQRDFMQRFIAGQENERKRIARELHDQTGQALASFMVELKVLEKAESKEELFQGIKHLKGAITEEMDTIHNLAVELRPSVLDDLGLISAIKMYVQEFEKRYDITARLTVIGFAEKRAEICVETCAYRIIQEALTNCVKHAEASELSVILEWRGSTIRGVIEDNGQGFDLEQVATRQRMGIYGMQERAELLNGSFSIESDPEVGTLVRFDIPATTTTCYE